MRQTLALLALALAAVASAKPHDHRFDLLDVRWKITFDMAQGVIMGAVVNTISPARGMSEVRLDAIGLDVLQAEVEGTPVAWKQDGDELVLDYPRAHRDKRTVSVHLVYTARPEAGVYFVPDARAYPSKTGMVYTQGEPEDTRYWLPTVDHPNDKATSEGFITTPADRFALSNGRLVETLQSGNTKTYHWRMLQPHSTYLISFAVGDYVEGREQWNGIPVNYYVPRGLEAEGKRSFGGTADIVGFFSKLTGFPYPYPKYAQSVVADYMFGGMENITATTQTIGTLHPESMHPLADSTGLVAHELAHQWFGDTVTCADWPHLWINEGFASFLPAFYTRYRDGEAAYDLARADTLGGAFGASQNLSRSQIHHEYVLPIDLFDGFAYGGGAARMFMLMHAMGEVAFWDGVREYLETFRYRNVTTESFFAQMEKRSGMSLEAFRLQWFYTPGAPKISVSRIGLELKVRNTVPGFKVEVPLWAWDQGKWVPRSLTLDGVAEATVDVPVQVRLVLVDPEVWLMAQVDYDLGYTPAEWAELYRQAPNAGQKARLLGAFPADVRSEVAKQLVAGEKMGALRSRLLDAVGKDASGLLLRHAGDADPFARRSALQSMGRQPKSDALVEVLTDAWRHDRNDLIRRAALESLVNMTADEGLVRTALNTPGFQETFRTYALGWLVRNKPDDARKVALEWVTHPENEALRTAALGHLGGLKDASGSRAVFDALVSVAQERSFQARGAAIRSLQAYGDARAIPVLEPITKNGLHFMRRTAQAAIDALRK